MQLVVVCILKLNVFFLGFYNTYFELLHVCSAKADGVNCLNIYEFCYFEGRAIRLTDRRPLLVGTGVPTSTI